MPPTNDEPVTSLLAQVDVAVNAGELPKAASILREASQLQPDKKEIKDRWLTLQAREASDNGVVEAIKSYIQGRLGEDVKGVVQALTQKQLNAVDSTEAYNALVAAPAQTKASDEVLGTLLGRQVEARRLVATKLSISATEVFDQLCSKGDDTFRAFAGIALDNSLWESKEKQRSAQQDLFRLCIAALIDAGVERPDRLMKAVARQLAVQPNNVADLIDEDVYDIVLSELDIRHDNSLRSQAMVAMTRLLEVSQDDGERLFASFVTTHVSRATNDDLIMAFSAAAAVFPVLPAVASRLFLTEGFLQGLMPHLEKNSEAAVGGKK